MTNFNALAETVTIDHVGFVVPDLDAAIQFFKEVLGFELLQMFNPVSDETGNTMSDVFGVHPRAGYCGAFLIANNGQKVELTEWSGPDQRCENIDLSHIHARHIAFSVPDLNKAARYLAKQPGVEVYAISEYGFFYFRTPWGMHMQIVQASE
ncbi:bleomycin resistance protein [Pseudomaricurvus alkylphenolicus]|uniref:VOC family protein n=1 Tax=Pseudomaricurvus alkylphenolicus TaxID=1306991 RepID=UPI00141E432B|nr:VOC family protein [Pseudomaricurvus alkylphenolicus]NIB40840.1 bleomycin resistance protein [Pseudomaricurvus alkylphenolicus]